MGLYRRHTENAQKVPILLPNQSRYDFGSIELRPPLSAFSSRQ